MNAPSLQEPDWRKSSYSGRNTNCVEVAGLEMGTAMRDTKHRELGLLAFDRAEWNAFIGAAQGEHR